MINVIKYCFFVFTILLLTGYKTFAQLPLGSGTAGNNLVANPGFEEGQNPWQLDNWMKNEVMAGPDSNYLYGGKWSMKV